MDNPSDKTAAQSKGGLFQSVGSFVSSALDFNKATLSGSLDIIAVRYDDGSLKSTPFHVRFGKLKVFRTRNKRVRIICNDEETGLFMRLGDAGEAYFEEEAENGEVTDDDDDHIGSTDTDQSHDSDSFESNNNKREKNRSSVTRKSSLVSETISSLSASSGSPPQNVAADSDASSTGLKSLPNLEADGSITLDGRFIGTINEWRRSSPTSAENSPFSTSPVEKTAAEIVAREAAPTSTIKAPDSVSSRTNAQKNSSWSWMWGELPQKSEQKQELPQKSEQKQESLAVSNNESKNAAVSDKQQQQQQQQPTVTNNRSQSLDRPVTVNTNSPKRALSAEITPRRLSNTSKMKERRKQHRLKTARLSRGRTGVLGSVVSFLAGQRSYLPEFSDSSSDEDDFSLDVKISSLSSRFSLSTSASQQQTKIETTSATSGVTTIASDSRDWELLVESRRLHRTWFNRRLSLSEGYHVESRSRVEENQRPPLTLSPLPVCAPPWHSSKRYNASSHALTTRGYSVPPTAVSRRFSRSSRRVSSSTPRFEDESQLQHQQQKQPSGRKSRNDRSRRYSGEIVSPPSRPSPPPPPSQSSFDEQQYDLPQRSSSPHSPLSTPINLRRCASSSPKSSFSAKKKAMKLFLSSATERSPFRKGSFVTSTINTSMAFSDVLQPILHPLSAIRNYQRSETRGLQRRRAASLDIFSLTRSQRDSCHDAFGLWAIRMTTSTSKTTSTERCDSTLNVSEAYNVNCLLGNNVDPSTSKISDTKPNTISSLPPSTSQGGSRRISKRERFLGWIPVIGPLVIPKYASAVASANNPSLSDTVQAPVTKADGGGGNAIPPSSTLKSVQSSRKSLVPTADQLRHLGKSLRDGANRITFEVEGSGVKVESRLYVWSPHSKIVISDVDGTITKSDVLGHIFFYVGRDWTHLGVAQLYSSITANGYNIVYLTSRAIGQTDATRVYLQNIKQFAPGSSMATSSATAAASATASSPPHISNPFITTVNSSQAGANSAQSLSSSLPSSKSSTRSSFDATSSYTSPSNSNSLSNPKVDSPTPAPPVSVDTSPDTNEPVFQLPPGPVITSPDRLFTAFTREVILRRPQEFKIAALSNILSLFPDGSSPIIAGFGNRDTDVLAYRAVGVPNGRIFIISPTGEVQTDNKTFQKSYAWINSHVDNIFPFCKQVSAADSNVGARMGIPLHQNFTDAEFWKRSLPKLSLEDEADAKSKGSTSGSSTASLSNKLTSNGIKL